MATLKLAIPKSGSPTKVAHGLYNCVSFSCRSQFNPKSQEKPQTQTIVKYRKVLLDL